MSSESRGRTERVGCGVEYQFAVTAVWLWTSHLNWLSIGFLTSTMLVLWVMQDHRGRIGLPLRGCSWMVSKSGKQCSQPHEEPLPATPFILSQTPGLFIEKKSKVYWNFKLHLRNQNPSGKCSPPQNLLETSSLSTSPRHHQVKAIALFIPCPQKQTNKQPPPSKPIFTWKFSTNMKKSFWITMWSPS